MKIFLFLIFCMNLKIIPTLRKNPPKDRNLEIVFPADFN